MSNWVEPTRSIPLTWGTYTERYIAGLVLIIGGAVQIQGANTWALSVIVIGGIAHILGWAILPAQGWRRIVAVVPSVGGVFVVLAGPNVVVVLAVVLACWVLVRQRPARSYVVVLLPVASGLVFSQTMREYSGMPAALLISAIVLFGSAWLARLIAVSAPTGSRIPSEVR